MFSNRRMTFLLIFFDGLLLSFFPKRSAPESLPSWKMILVRLTVGVFKVLKSKLRFEVSQREAKSSLGQRFPSVLL